MDNRKTLAFWVGSLMWVVLGCGSLLMAQLASDKNFGVKAAVQSVEPDSHTFTLLLKKGKSREPIEIKFDSSTSFMTQSGNGEKQEAHIGKNWAKGAVSVRMRCRNERFEGCLASMVVLEEQGCTEGSGTCSKDDCKGKTDCKDIACACQK